eukprot:CAMPEP_0172697832 /NCGR_PEP_ID=MMETSP1074-20121228/29018_1 /TAXON_ID=2916 /ORGANISM="Ceratium fusus, Strain PA161109" /LENGTH=30 /DNA_ID= /DNA_START= /DNA_END= /DNA_ORIENTATION=
MQRSSYKWATASTQHSHYEGLSPAVRQTLL